MRFTDGHSSAGACTPSRYSLLTGRYDLRSRLQRGVFGGFGGPPLIPSSRLTIAGLAKQNGYRTACIGKWHLGWNWPMEKNDQRLLGTASFEQIGRECEQAGAVPTPSIERWPSPVSTMRSRLPAINRQRPPPTNWRLGGRFSRSRSPAVRPPLASTTILASMLRAIRRIASSKTIIPSVFPPGSCGQTKCSRGDARRMPGAGREGLGV